MMDVTTRLPKVLGSIYFPENNLTSGSVSDARLTQGELFYFFSPGRSSRPYYDGWPAPGPNVSLSGSRLSWSWDSAMVSAWKAAVAASGENHPGDSYLHYGIF